MDLFKELWDSNIPTILTYLRPKLSTPPPEQALVLEAGDSIDEINKWILARKKNFPSSKKIPEK
jgi:hypothetical protein